MAFPSALVRGDVDEAFNPMLGMPDYPVRKTPGKSVILGVGPHWLYVSLIQSYAAAYIRGLSGLWPKLAVNTDLSCQRSYNSRLSSPLEWELCWHGGTFLSQHLASEASSGPHRKLNDGAIQ